MTISKRKATRNAQGAGSIRQRKDGKWEARYTVGRNPGTGKQIQKSVYGDTEKDVRKKLTQATAAIDEGVYFEPSKLTLSAWLDIWLAEYMGDKKFLTVKHYKAQCNTHIKPALGAVKLSTLKSPMIQKFYNTLKNGAGGKKPLSPKSIKNVHGILHKSLSQAIEIGYLKTNPTNGVILPRITKKEIQPLTDTQVSAFIKAVEGDDYATLFKVILLTGLRKSEALGLTWDNVNFETGVITVEKQLQSRPMADGGPTLESLKNEKPRRLTPALFVMQLLKAHEVEQKKMRLQAGSVWQGWSNERERSTALVFTNELGRYIRHETMSKRYKKIVAGLGIPDACVHDLRHTYAVISLQSGDNPKTVQEALGHHTAAFTLDVYGHVSETMRKDSADRMQAYIQAVQNL